MHEQPAPTADPLGVLAGVQLLDQRQVDGGVVGAAVVLQQLLTQRVRGRIEVVHGRRIEDTIGVGAVVGRAVPVLAQHRVHRRIPVRRVQVVHHLGGALPGTDDDERAMRPRRQPIEMAEEIVVVELPRRRCDSVGQGGGQSSGEHDVASPHGPASSAFGADAVPVAGVDDVHRSGAVVHCRIDLVRGPRQVVVELESAREERLQVDEVVESALLGQIGQKGVLTAGVALGRQVLEERDLHRRPRQQHAGVPRELVLGLDEAGRQSFCWSAGSIVLLDRDGQTEIGGPESDSEDVVVLVRGHRTLAPDL